MKKIRKNFLKYFMISIILFGTFISSVLIGYIGNFVKDQKVFSYEEMKYEINNVSQNSSIYFNNGEKVATINHEIMRKTIPLEKMGENVKNAIIASEDANFYNNIGIEPRAIIRVSFNEIIGKSSFGGSTLTQQLVKNQLLDSSRSYERKAKEIMLALRLNKHFKKEEILEAYLNMAPFGKNKLGQNISGIETAANGIFGVSASELNIAQASYLVGFVQSPFKYTPFNSVGELRSDEELQYGFDRQKYVLNRMLSEGYITKKEYEEAIKFDIKSSFIQSMPDDRESYPYIVNEVITSATEILAKKNAENNNKLDEFNTNAEFKNKLIEKSKLKFITGGYKVKTTIDKGIYDALENAKNNYNGFLTKNIKGKNEVMQVGATLIENSTGKILAFIAGTDYKKQQLNHATRTSRSPGSTIKPLLVYAPAMEKEYITPNSLILDKRFDYRGWKPENFSKTEYNLITVRNALAKSLNLSTIRLYSAFFNEDPVKEYLEKMNFRKIVPEDHHTLAAAIGGLAYGVTVTENTNAFSTFANEGMFKQAYIIEEILDKDDNIIYKANFEPIKIYSKETSYLILNILHDVITANGTAPDIAAAARFNTQNLFVKTGTSEFNHDLWAVGGTKNITFGLWTGYDTPAEINGFSHAHNQWIYFMNTINSNFPNIINANSPFEKPNNINYRSINPLNNDIGEISDLVPSHFKSLDEKKVLNKFGFNIDPKTPDLLLEIEKEKQNEDKEKEDDEREINENNVNNDESEETLISNEDNEENTN